MGFGKDCLYPSPSKAVEASALAGEGGSVHGQGLWVAEWGEELELGEEDEELVLEEAYIVFHYKIICCHNTEAHMD